MIRCLPLHGLKRRVEDDYTPIAAPPETADDCH